MAATIAQLRAQVFVDGVGPATGQLGAFGKAVDQTASKSEAAASKAMSHDKALRTVGTGSLIAGGALLAGFGMAAGAAMNFDKEMSGVGAVSDASAKQMDRLRDAAIEAGQATVFSASDAARAEAELAKAGVSTADILSGALRGSLDLAAAGQLDLARSAEIAAQAMNIFDLGGQDVAHVADVLAAGANKSAAGVDDLGMSLQQGGLVASQYGLSLEDTVGTLALFADNALTGSDAGTSLKTMLQRLSPISAEAKAQMDELGFSAYDAQGNFVGIEAVAGRLQTSLKGLTQEQRDTALATMFGSDAVRGANALIDAGEKGVRKYIRAVNDQGAAGRMAGKQLDNLSGDVEQLSGSLETALIKNGSAATGVLRGMTQGATDVVNAFVDLPGPVQAAATGIAGVGGAALVTIGALGYMAPKVGEGVRAVKSLTEWMRDAEGASKAAAIGIKGLALAGAGLAVYSVVSGYFDDATQAAKEYAAEVTKGNDLRTTQGQIDQYRTLTAELEKWTRIRREATKDSGDDFLGRGFKTLGDWTGLDPNQLIESSKKIDALKSKMAGLRDTIHKTNEVRTSLGGLLGTGFVTEAELSSSAITKVADSLGVDLVGKGKLSEGQAKAVAKALRDQTSAAYGTEESLDGIGRAAGDAESELKAFEDTMNGLLGVHLDAREADIQFRDSLAALTAEVKEHGFTLDLNTEQGRRNQELMIGATRQALQHAVAVGKETDLVDAANLTLAAHIGTLADTAKQLGMTDEQTLIYLEDLYGIPAEKRTDIHTTADLAALLVQGLGRDIANLPASKDVNINVWRREHAVFVGDDPLREFLSGGGGRGHAAGGRIGMGNEWTWVGEQGRELVRLPGGSEVYSNAASERLMPGAPNEGAGATYVWAPQVTVQAEGIVVDDVALGKKVLRSLDAVRDAGMGDLSRRFSTTR